MDEGLQNEKFTHRRLLIIGAVMLGGAALLLGRLWYVQVVQVHKLSGAASEQSVRRIRLSPQRGRIIDREQRLLIDNRPSYDVVFHPSAMRRPGGASATIDYVMEQAQRIAEVIHRKVEIEPVDVERHLHVRPLVPLTVFQRLSETELARVSEQLPMVNGIEVKVRYIRDYMYPGSGAHVLGFTGRRRPPDEMRNRQYSYVMPEPRGRAGLELYYDDELAGRPGMQMVRVDPTGYVHEEIGRIHPPQDGMDLILSVDIRAQQIAEQVMAGKKGAFVLVNARNGAVLALASSPTYDLSTLTSGEYARLAQNEEDRPLVNRALAGGYLPGSIVKPLVGLAALESGAIEIDHEVHCTGSYPLGNIGCWLRSGHGDLTIVEAIEQSCNSFFIDIGLETGLDELRPLFLEAGLGHAPDLDLNNVGNGLVPSRPWARQHIGRPWIAIDTAYLSIGQGSIGLSPLQGALYTAAIANGGTVYRPFLVERILDADGQTRKQTAPRPFSNLTVSTKHLDIIRAGMTRVVNSPNGSAKRAQTPAISLAGKTGTAEVQTPGDEHNNTWFIGYGPVDAPRYAVCVLVEYGESGGRTAAPLAREFFERWLGEQSRE